MKKVTVFYEDDGGLQIKNFGPHILALACVADARQSSARADPLDRYVLQDLAVAVPMNGNANLRRTIRGIAHPHVIVLYDSDRVRDLYGLPAAAAPEEVERVAGLEAGGAIVLLLVRNIEDVLSACCNALNVASPQRKPTPQERDHVLHQAAAAAPAVRSSVLAACPSWARFVRVLGEEISQVEQGRPL